MTETASKDVTSTSSEPKLKKIKKKNYKMIIRRLPVGMTSELLLEKLGKLPIHDRYWFREPDEWLEDDALPYAFVVFNEFENAAKFQRQFNGQVLADADGKESKIVVEKAANQDYAKQASVFNEENVRPITKDVGYIKFVEEAETSRNGAKVDFDVMVNEIVERERKHAQGVCQETPLTDYFVKKAHEKLFKGKPSRLAAKAAAAKTEKFSDDHPESSKTKPRERRERNRNKHDKPKPEAKDIKSKFGSESAKKPHKQLDQSSAASASTTSPPVKEKKREYPKKSRYGKNKEDDLKASAKPKEKDASTVKEPTKPLQILKKEAPAKTASSEAVGSSRGSGGSADKKDEESNKKRNKDRPERQIYQPKRGRTFHAKGSGKSGSESAAPSTGDSTK